MPGEKCLLSIFSCRFVAPTCVSCAESCCARCPCCRNVCAVAGHLMSYSYLVLKHQILAHLHLSRFYDHRSLFLAKGGCDQTQGSGSARIMDGITSPRSLTCWYARPPHCVSSPVLQGGSQGAAQSLTMAALSTKAGCP